MKTDPFSDATFQALVDIKRTLAEKLNLLEEHIRGAQLNCLEKAFQKHTEALAECLDGIDQQLINLSVYFEEYQQIAAELKNINEKILGFGGNARPLPEPFLENHLAGALAARLNTLSSQGKIGFR